MIILGINEGANASAALLKNGKIIACVQEERLSRIKNHAGVPWKSINYCLVKADISTSDIDLVVFGAKNPIAAVWLRTNQKSSAATFFRKIELFIFEFFSSLAIFRSGFYFILQWIYNVFYLCYKVISPIIKLRHIQMISQKLKIPRNRITNIDHHLAHAYAAYFIAGRREESTLVITNDGAGDQTCGKVFIVKNDIWKEMSATPNQSSLAYVYYYTTALLGFTPNEQEYKVMGLAPYGYKADIEKIYPIFKRLIWSEGLTFRSSIERISYFSYLKRELTGKRFDTVAGAVQKLVEELLVKQFRSAIKKTGIRNVVYGGGLAMNVKANMKILQIPELKNLFVCPSAGDESAAIGACFWGYQAYCQKNKRDFSPEKLESLAMGPAYSTKEILEVLRKKRIIRNYRYNVKKLGSNKPAVIAKLLAGGHIIGRFVGRMEFGARALGNRSILAHPGDARIVQKLNSQIKYRDFWMPFAPVILSKRQSKYLVNPKNIQSPYMMIAFEATEKAKLDLPATLHPKDLTCRPQIINQEINPDYYAIITQFEGITGISALLNTSLNIHGEPIVCSPDDAIDLFLKTDLQYLLVEDFLLKKTHG